MDAYSGALGDQNVATRQPLPSCSSLLSPSFCLCHSCYASLQPKIQRFRVKGARAYALFPYSETFRSMLFQYKGCGDIELAPAFIGHVIPYFRFWFLGYSFVPVPSSKEHDEKRGFNQIGELLRFYDLPVIDVLRKPFLHKQSDMSVKDRGKVKDLLRIVHPEKVEGKKVVLVDDVYTTGATCSSCVELLKKAKAKAVKVLVLARVEKKSRAAIDYGADGK